MLKYILLACCLACAAFAVEPDEVLNDPALEARARVISKDLRCLVCRNENIDSSNAGIARDLRLLVRERLVAGDEDAQVVDYIVDRYGEYVLLRPARTLSNLFLWAAGPVLFLVGGGVMIAFVRRKRTAPAEALTQEEQDRLDQLLGD